MQKPFIFFFFRLHVQVNLLNDANSRLQTQKRKVRIILKELETINHKRNLSWILKEAPTEVDLETEYVNLSNLFSPLIRGSHARSPNKDVNV